MVYRNMLVAVLLTGILCQHCSKCQPIKISVANVIPNTYRDLISSNLAQEI